MLLIQSDAVRWLIQVKQHASTRKREPFSTIQQILGTLVLQRGRHGIVVTTAGAFTSHARNASLTARREGFVVELVDRGLLDEMLGPLIPRRPWARLFADPELVQVASAAAPALERSLQPYQLGIFDRPNAC